MRDEMIPEDDQGVAQEIWHEQRVQEEDLPAAKDSESAGLTFSKFLECLDKRIYESYARPKGASVNKYTLTFLVNSIGFPAFEVSISGVGVCQIYGVLMEIDERLPDHAIKIGCVVYNAPKEIETAKHDGKLDALPPHTDPHADVEINEYDRNPCISIFGGYGDCESSSVYLAPAQALSLLNWLQQERETLEQLAKEQGG